MASGDSISSEGASKTKGLLVAFEGIDGAGKTTQARALARALSNAGVPFLATKEPTSGPWGQRIRQSAVHGRLPLAEELQAFLADRREHVQGLIRPGLEDGNVVIIDRYYPSTVAYQGALGLDPADLLAMNEFAPKPDVLIILDVSPEIGLARVRSRGDVADLFEKEDELTRARQIFLALNQANTYVLEGTNPIETLTQSILALVGGRLGVELTRFMDDYVEVLRRSKIVQILESVLRDPEVDRGRNVEEACSRLLAAVRGSGDAEVRNAPLVFIGDVYIEQFLNTALLEPALPERVRRGLDAAERAG